MDFCFLSGLCGGGGGGGFGIAPLQDEPPPLIYIGDRGGGGVLVPCLAGAGPLQPGQSYCGAKLDPCANATLSATGVNIRENIAQAQSTISVGRMMGITGGSYNAARGTVGALFNYAMLVGTGGPQDVKNQRGPGTPQQRCRKHKLRYYLFFRHSLLSVRGRCRSNSHCQAKFQRNSFTLILFTFRYENAGCACTALLTVIHRFDCFCFIRSDIFADWPWRN